MEDQLPLPNPAFEEHRKEVISSLFGRMHKQPWMLFNGERRSTKSILQQVEHRTELGDRFVRQTSTNPDVQL